MAYFWKLKTVTKMETESKLSEFCGVKCESSASVTCVTSAEFDKICRCCLSAENKLCPIFDVQCDGNSFSQLLHTYTSVHVSIRILLNVYYRGLMFT